MTFSEELAKNFYTTIRIVTRNELNESIEGTAFIFEYKTEDNNYPFMITARSNVEHTFEGRMTLMLAKAGKPLLGKGYSLDIEHFERLWFSHPDIDLDIAVTPFVPFVKHIEASGSPVYFHALSNDVLAKSKSDNLCELGDDVVFISYPQGRWDKKQLLPVLRKGMVATPLSADYLGEQQFLLDTVVLPGCAGSPVFQLCAPDRTKVPRPYLLGMLVYATPYEEEADANREGERCEQTSNMGVVIRSEVLLRTITGYLQDKGFI